MRAIGTLGSRGIRLAARWTVMLAVLGAALLTTGCEDLPPFFRFFLGAFRLDTSAAKGGAQDYFLAFQTKRKTPDGSGFAITPPRDLWPPFCVEIRAGLPDASKVNAMGDGFFCMTVAEPGIVTRTFYGLCAVPTNGGLLAFATRSAGNGGQRFFAGASFVDFQFETDGDEIVCRARDATDANYVELDRFPIEHPGVPLRAGFGIERVNAGALVGFDLFRVKQNGDQPGGMTALEALVRAIFEGTDASLEALYTADGDSPDLVAVTAHLDDAIGQVEASLAVVDGLQTAVGKKKQKTPLQSAAKSLKKARKFLAKARGKTSKGKFNKGAAKKILKGVRAQLEAGATLEDETD